MEPSLHWQNVLYLGNDTPCKKHFSPQLLEKISCLNQHICCFFEIIGDIYKKFLESVLQNDVNVNSGTNAADEFMDAFICHMWRSVH